MKFQLCCKISMPLLLVLAVTKRLVGTMVMKLVVPCDLIDYLGSRTVTDYWNWSVFVRKRAVANITPIKVILFEGRKGYYSCNCNGSNLFWVLVSSHPIQTCIIICMIVSFVIKHIGWFIGLGLLPLTPAAVHLSGVSLWYVLYCSVVILCASRDVLCLGWEANLHMILESI